MKISEKDLRKIGDFIDKSNGNYAVVTDAGEVIFNRGISATKMAYLYRTFQDLINAYFKGTAETN